MLQRMRELAVQAANGTNDTDDIANLNKEFASLATEIDRVADSTEFNGIQVLKGDILNDQLSFVVGQDTSAVNKMNVAFSDFNLADGASKVDEVLGSEVLLRAVGDSSAIAGDLGSGLSIFVSDGTTSISVDLADVRVAANNATLVASSASHANIATALQTKATANSAFLLTIEANGTSGFKFIEKAGSGDVVDTAGDLAKYTGTASVAFTFAGAVAGTGSGVMGESLSAYKSTLSGSAKNVDTSTTVGEIDVAIKGVA
jgi:flagellin